MSSARPGRLEDMTTTTATFTGISTVAIPASDPDATKAFFEDLGFITEFDGDVAPDFRWIAMAAPDGRAGISVIAATGAVPAGIDTGIRFVTPDARAAHARLAERGLDVGALLDWPTAPLMFEFQDFDGNTMYVSEPS
jgi:catechol 2,3-dioxygenase-like lactoylglutathione lyase family enzyme